jgi:hypothetical protein
MTDSPVVVVELRPEPRGRWSAFLAGHKLCGPTVAPHKSSAMAERGVGLSLNAALRFVDDSGRLLRIALVSKLIENAPAA